MNALMIIIILVFFCYFGDSYCPSVLKKNKEILLGIAGGLVLCSFFGMRIEGLGCDNIDERSSEVNIACCGDKDCVDGPPTDCSEDCAKVFLPFWSDCSERLPQVLIDNFSNIVNMCLDPCTRALDDTCGETEGNVFDCAKCAERNLQALTSAGCDNQSISSWCASNAQPISVGGLVRRPCADGMNTWMNLGEYLNCSCDDTLHLGKGAARTWAAGGGEDQGSGARFQCRALGVGDFGGDDGEYLGDPDNERNICDKDKPMIDWNAHDDPYKLDKNGFPCICPLGPPGNEDRWAPRRIELSEFPNEPWLHGDVTVVWGLTYEDVMDTHDSRPRREPYCCGCVGGRAGGQGPGH